MLSPASFRPIRPHFSKAHACGLSFCRRAGFSLIELLVVIAVIVVLGSVAVPAFNSIGQARGVDDAISQVDGMLELARIEALRRGTYVWLGFKNAELFGSNQLVVSMVSSKDGSTSTDASNLLALARQMRVRDAGLVAAATVSGATDYPTAVDFLTNTAPGFSDAGTEFRDTVLTFTPDGEVLLDQAPVSTDGFEEEVAFGVAGFRGTTPLLDSAALVVVDGSAGFTQTIRAK